MFIKGEYTLDSHPIHQGKGYAISKTDGLVSIFFKVVQGNQLIIQVRAQNR